MDTQKVYHKLQMMAGEGQEAQELLLMICSSAVKEIRLAYYMLTLLRCGSSDNMDSFKAGDVSVTRNVKTSLELAAQVRDSYMELASDLLCDSGFDFRRVTA